MICLECLFNNHPAAVTCGHCGKPLIIGCRFAILSAPGNRIVIVPLPPSGEIVIGREDAVGGIFPDLDTSSLVDSAGVSRRHARVRRRVGQWFVVPFETTNPTWVNGIQAAPNQEVPIAAQGDTLALGGLIVSVFAN